MTLDIYILPFTETGISILYHKDSLRCFVKKKIFNDSTRELRVAQIVSFLVVELAFHVSIPRLGTGARIFLVLFSDFSGCSFSGRRRSH